MPPSTVRPLRVLISAGEASGEMYGAALLDSLRTQAAAAGISSIECFGLGGERMRASGCETVVDAKNVAVVGLAEVVRHLPRIYGEFSRLIREVEKRRPDVAILIDFPDWNFRLAKQLHRRGIPVVYYVSPQLWAWRKGRLKLVQRYISKMLVIFPFEQEFYSSHGVQAQFVGHPLGELELPSISRQEIAARFGLDPERDWIALLPGSRHGEVHRNLPELLKVASQLGTNYDFVLPLASTLHASDLGVPISKDGFIEQPNCRIAIVDDARAALMHSRAAVVASGTATVETAVIGTPFVMVYRLSPLTFAVGKRLVNVPHYGMVNLIAGRRIVPELIQDAFTAERVIAELTPLLADAPRRDQMMSDLAEVRAKLRGQELREKAADKAARAVLEVATASLPAVARDVH